MFEKLELGYGNECEITREIVKTEKCKKQAVELDMVCTTIKTLSAVPKERWAEFGIDPKELGAKLTEMLTTLFPSDEAREDA